MGLTGILSRGIALAWLAVGLTAVASGAEPARHTVRADDGHEIVVWRKSPAGPPAATLLLIHGRTWSARPDFDLQAPGNRVSLMDGLVARNIATYAVDLRGYGGTARDATGWLTPARAAADATVVLRWLAGRDPDAKAPAVFGWSYGSMVAQLAVQNAPDVARALILFGYPVRPGVDASPVADNSPPPRAPTTAKAAASDFITRAATDPRVIDAFVQSALIHDPVRADWRHLAQWRALDGARITVPTLLLQAEHDPLALPDVHARLFERIASPDKQWTVIPGGDHAAFLESPRAYFIEVIDTFLTKARMRRTAEPL